MTEHIITPQRTLMILSRHIGAENGACAEDLVIEITESADHIEAGKRRFRNVIERLRGAGHHICATPRDGYYIAANDAELTETCEYLYSRAITSLSQISAMKRVSLPDLRGQLRLPT